MQEGKIIQIELNPNTQVKVFGQEIKPKSFAIAYSYLLIKGENAGHICCLET